MKVKAISRSLDDHLPQVHGAPPPKQRNLDPNLHPMARSREYTRAVTASKLDRMFAKPFVDALEGHMDGVQCSSRDVQRVGSVVSGSALGDVIVWSLPSRSAVRKIRNAHEGFVKGVCFTSTSTVPNTTKDEDLLLGSSSRKNNDDDEDEDVNLDEEMEMANQENEELTAPEEAGLRSNILTCGADKTVKLWSTRAPLDNHGDEPIQTFMGKTAFNCIDHHRYEPAFATASDRVQIWDENRTDPVLSLLYSGSSTSQHADKDNFSGEHIVSAKFNQSESSVLASTGSDRSLCLYDLRSGTATSRITMQMRGNQVSFNPLQPPILLVASEDQNLYTFDIRNLKSATQVFKGHVGPVMSCDWSPTGRSFVSGSYDKTIRLWDASHGHSRDTYHTKRMQRVFTTIYSSDSRFVLSGSEDGNLRIWKSRASDKLGVKNVKEKSRINYRDSLREKWKHVGEVSKIERQRFLPATVHKTQKQRREMDEAARRKEENRRAHAPKHKRDSKPKAERKKAILSGDN